MRRERPAAPRFSTLVEYATGVVLDCDEAFAQMFGYRAQELIGKQVLDHIHEDDRARAVEGWMTMLSSKRMQQTRLRRRRKDGSFMWVDTTLHNYLNDPDRQHVIVENIDVSAEMAAQAALQEQGELLRRLPTATTAPRSWPRSNASSNASRVGSACVLYIDLDHFMSVNDTLGHGAGDELLVIAAERLRTASRADDDIGRLGGDELLVLVRNLPECQRGFELAGRVANALHDTLELSAGPVELRASIGVACSDGEQITAAALIERADAAMYRCKSDGCGVPVFADADVTA